MSESPSVVGRDLGCLARACPWPCLVPRIPHDVIGPMSPGLWEDMMLRVYLGEITVSELASTPQLPRRERDASPLKRLPRETS